MIIIGRLMILLTPYLSSIPHFSWHVATSSRNFRGTLIAMGYCERDNATAENHGITLLYFFMKKTHKLMFTVVKV
jgi:hypothetical protein